jgi:hypothetical protein
MDSRMVESALLDKCVDVARGAISEIDNPRDANVFRIAGMVVRSKFPAEASNLIEITEAYFRRFPSELLSAEEVLREGWIISLPRLKDSLSMRLR